MNSDNKSKLNFWSIFSGVVLIAFFVMLVIKFSNLEDFYNTLKQGTWYLIILLFIIEAMYLYNQSLIFRSLFKIFKEKPSIKKILKIFLAANFINMVVPSGGISGVSIFSKAGPQAKVDKTEAVVINFLYYLITYGTFSVIMILGLIFLFTIHKLQPYHYISGGLLLIFVGVFFTIFYLGYKHKDHLEGLLNGIGKFINFFGRIARKKNIITKDNIEDLHGDIVQSADKYRTNKHVFFEPVAYAILGHILQITILYVCFLAFGATPALSTVIVGYVFSVIFVLVSPTPSGVGIVEPTMALIMASLGTNIETATIATLAFRGVVFWFPFFIGFYASRRLKLA